MLAVPFFLWTSVYDPKNTRKAAAVLEGLLAQLVAAPGGRGAAGRGGGRRK